ncbi:hypothetical protein CRG98_046680 [Punica granatum]|uniref:Uncharacterized protein n=1 Tax=Punica granatum TaxID=22663 RepID=A0A2I0HMH8_PUNGR|nr:hypothetical protein CRG98_046680 [Punica granatum]
MAGLQRSAVSFRRQAPHSSGLVWDDRFLLGKLNQVNNEADNEANKPKDPDGRKCSTVERDGAAPAIGALSPPPKLPPLSFPLIAFDKSATTF